MTDAHFHRNGFATFLETAEGEVCFRGIHPWCADETSAAPGGVAAAMTALEAALTAEPALGVGEIGLDRLKTRVISAAQRTLFAEQLALAARLGRPVVLHGAKCWGEVVKACQPHVGRIPAFLFHGFSRSGGLLPDIVRLNGFIGVGKAILNDHAVNYRALVAEIPHDRLVAETDEEDGPERHAHLAAVRAKICALAGVDDAVLDANALRFARGA